VNGAAGLALRKFEPFPGLARLPLKERPFVQLRTCSRGVIMEESFGNRRLFSIEPAYWALFLSGIALGAVFILLT
jgi:hypothetical protein